MKSKFQISQILIFFILGLFITVQMKSIQKETKLTNIQKDLNQLQQVLKLQKETSGALDEQAKTYQKRLEDYENTYLKGNGIDVLKTELDNARFIAGLTDVGGSGIIITLDDSKKRIAEGVDPNNTVIHDSDLIEIINSLRYYGAEAMSINDERIVSTSEIQCAGPTVSVNNIRYAVPFVIKAIGNADYLEAGIKTQGNIIDIMSIYGIQINIKKDNKITIPKYNPINNTISTAEVGG